MMVYPEIDTPMYEPLEDDVERVPRCRTSSCIEDNTITLLETNQKFIEAYMVGLNHEFARELLWREYPTDQRGSYFRQFWDVARLPGRARGRPDGAARATARHPRAAPLVAEHSGLGEHDHREAQGDKEDEVVLAIRGELLKKYPTAVIYAHRAAWERTGDGRRSTGPSRAGSPTSPAGNPPRDLVKTPLYEAKVDPDIYFFGFDLTAEKAKGGQHVDGEEDPGWFFVIKERPGEPRFGLDLPQGAPQGADQHLERAGAGPT